MKTSLSSVVLLSLYATHIVASPIADLEERDDDCYMEWVTVYGDAPTGSSASLSFPTAGLAGARRPFMQSPSSVSVAAGTLQSNTPIEAAKQYESPEKGSSASEDASLATSSAAAGSSAAALSSTASSTPSKGGSTGLSPGGKKAGISGFEGVTSKAGWTQFTSKISWYSDYTPNPADSGSVKGIGMLWGDGSQGSQDSSRLATFTGTVATANPAPAYMMGFYEPDWTPPDSSAIDSSTAASDWAKWLAPLGAKGTKLGSPSLAKQMDETWLTPFENAPEKPTWDFTCIHTNKNSSAGVQADVEYYYNKYKKPVWVSEFSCMNDLSWTGCDDPTTFIKETVAYLEGSEMVVAYGYSNGDGLPESWKIFDGSGGLSDNGKTYLAALGG